MTFTEQRRHERVAVDIQVYWGWTSDCPFRGRVINLGVGGYFLRTDRGAPRGRPVFLKFWLPDERTLSGEVRYELELMGVGVEFVGLSEAEARNLAELVEFFRAAAPQ